MFNFLFLDFFSILISYSSYKIEYKTHAHGKPPCRGLLPLAERDPAFGERRAETGARQRIGQRVDALRPLREYAVSPPERGVFPDDDAERSAL